MTATEEIARLQYPIGPFRREEHISPEKLLEHIAVIEMAPAKYRAIAEGITPEDLKRTYRPGSWNIQQLFNHVADMQLLHFFRMKKALTEADYKEITIVNIDGWVNTTDGSHSDIEDSLIMFDGITRRYVALIKSLTTEQLDVSYYHPVRKISLNQRQAISMTSWHVQHHLEHIRIALQTNRQ